MSVQERGARFIVRRHLTGPSIGLWSWKRLSNGREIARSSVPYADLRGALRGIELATMGRVDDTVKGPRNVVEAAGLVQRAVDGTMRWTRIEVRR